MNAPSENLSLRWISLDLDEHVDTARRAFEAYLANPAADSASNKIQSVLASTQQAGEIFAEAQFVTACALTQEIAELIETILHEKTEHVQDFYQAVIGGFNQLLNYLSRIKQTGVDEPVALLAVINELRSTANKPLQLPLDQF
ncbi:MAG: hypothetical protein HKO71_03300, partial [Pseudomonadales bacterium]|nr:hypothetical protein [Gammaproteobacteria bacterium]NNL56753.1 hypothetical protein [Pseudomonadales bacterium]